MVIVLSLIIALLCSSLVAAAYYYRLSYDKDSRYLTLNDNLNSANNILLANSDNSLAKPLTLSLYGKDDDSVTMQKIKWGIFDVGISMAFSQNDTLKNAFSIANTIDSSKWAVLYLTDNKRPLSVSGTTMIKGNVFIPKSGIIAAYINNQKYSGKKNLVAGQINSSSSALPALLNDRLTYLESQFTSDVKGDSSLLNKDSVVNSFLSPVNIFRLSKKNVTLQNIKIDGNIIIYADSSVTIEGSARINHAVIFAKTITVKEGFNGNCQLFALDSIGLEKNCVFNYPSCLGVLRFKNSVITTIEHIHIGEHTLFNGTIFIYEKKNNNVDPVVIIDSATKIFGQIYVNGIVLFSDGAEIDGSIFTDNFIYKTNFSVFENYLINVKLDASSLSPYYLSSELMPVTSSRKKILEWLSKR